MPVISKSKKTMLVVDDDPSVTASIAMLLKQNGFNTVSASNPLEALEVLDQQHIDLVLQDMNFSRNTTGEEGKILLQSIKKSHNTVPVILMTAWGSIELAVEGIKLGASDFITKPWNNLQLLKLIETCLELNQSQPSQPVTRQALDEQYDFSAIIGNDPAMLDVLATIGRVAATNAPVLILGDSGTGKELIADAIHKNSK